MESPQQRGPELRARTCNGKPDPQGHAQRIVLLQVAPLGPRAIIIAHVGVVQELSEHESGVGRTHARVAKCYDVFMNLN